jgi:hypothetical protein
VVGGRNAQYDSRDATALVEFGASSDRRLVDMSSGSLSIELTVVLHSLREEAWMRRHSMIRRDLLMNISK